MAQAKIRLGGMALGNGVLVHGPTSWACAVRTEDGALKVVAERKRVLASGISHPLVRGPARLAEAFAFLPRVRRALPEAELPFARRRVLAAMLAGTVVIQAVRRSSLGAGTQELVGGALSFAPALLSFGGGGDELAAYHGAEHIAIGSYEHGEPRPREHERCGTHLVGPLIATGFVANVLASRAPAQARAAARAAATLGTLAGSMELFGWMQRHPEHRLSRALRRPGYELQHRLVTREPTPEQLEVAEAALRACLELERAGIDKPSLRA
jgi:uncharacterized protein YqhQ